MKYLINLCIVLSLFAVWGSPAVQAQQPAIKWLSFEEAQKEKRPDQSRKFLLYFYTDWCTYCRKLDAGTFIDKAVVDYINSNYIPVRINSEKLPKVAASHSVGGVPDLRFLSESGENIARWPGYIEADKLLPMLKYIHTNSYLDMSYTDFLKRQ